MSVLYLVRHGQTRGFHVDGYTDLTPLGVRQAGALGAWWRDRGPRPDRFVVGPRPRHAQTAAGLAGPDWPAPEVRAGLDEHAGLDVLTAVLEGRARLDDELRDAILGELGAGEVLRGFRRLLVGWATGRVHADGLETWPAFRARVASAVDDLLAERGRTVVAVTSGGFVGAAVAHVVADGAVPLADAVVEGLASAVENTALTEIRGAGARRTLVRFNSVAHLGADVPATPL